MTPKPLDTADLRYRAETWMVEAVEAFQAGHDDVAQRRRLLAYDAQYLADLLDQAQQPGILEIPKVERGLLNLGIDITCAACMGIFWTGAALEPHTCSEEKARAGVKVLFADDDDATPSSSQPPKEPGYYWWKEAERAPEIVKVEWRSLDGAEDPPVKRLRVSMYGRAQDGTLATHMGGTWLGRVEPPGRQSTTDDGYDKAPTRYMAEGRETVDRMRDYCHVLAAEWLGLPDEKLHEVADLLFEAACMTHAIKYQDRKGLKAGVDLQRDVAAAAWWNSMRLHVKDPATNPDPRSTRPDFIPYVRPQIEVDVLRVRG